MCLVGGASYSVLSTCVLLLPYGSDPHHLIIKGHLSVLFSLSLGTMPDTCHFCYAQELLSAQCLLGSPELEHSQNLFLFRGCGSGWPEWNSHVSFLSGPTEWHVGKKILEVHIRMLLMTKETPSHPPLAFPGVGRTVTLCCFSQGLSMALYFHLQRLTCCCHVYVHTIYTYVGMWVHTVSPSTVCVTFHICWFYLLPPSSDQKG